MDNTYERVSKKHPFIAILGSDICESGFKPYSKYLSDYFNNGGSMVYIYSSEEDRDLDYLSKVWEIDVSDIHKKGRIMFICRNNFSSFII